MSETYGVTPDDSLLAERAASGDRAAFEVLVRRYKQPLYRFVRGYAGDADDAYDILQDSFVAAWMSLSRYDPGRPFAPWLRMIALNKCRDFARRKTVRRVFLRMLALDASDEAQPQIDAAQEEIQASARLARLERAIAELPATYKEPLLLTTIEGLSQEEVAVTLKTTRKAIEMRLYRARHRLSEIMLEEEPET